MNVKAVPLSCQYFFSLLLFVSLICFTPNLSAQDCDGGSVSTVDGSTSVYTCPGDGLADSLNFSVAGNVGTNFSFVITDTAGVILGLPAGDGANFEGAGEGTCLVWGLSYEGDLTAAVGDTASAIALSDSCFDLSDNFVTINRGSLDGGLILLADESSSAYTCPGDSIPDVLSFIYTSNSLANFQMVITDTAGIILGLPDSTVADFEGAGEGTCLVWALQYTDSLLAEVGDDATSDSLATGCFALSESYVTVTRGELDGGTVTTTDGALQVYTCPGDSISDMISFTHTSGSEANLQLVITDTEGVILGLPDSTVADFEGAGEGTCLVWGLAYTGELTAAVGDTASAISFADGCAALSDTFVTITRGTLDGGMIYAEGEVTEVSVCTGDGIADIVSFNYSSGSMADFQLVVTDANGVILALPDSSIADFDGAGPGTCLAWGLYYTGDLLAQPGDTATSIDLASGCFALSDNFVTVNRISLEPSTILTADESLEVITCPGDGEADEVSFIYISDSTANFQIVITDAEGTILGLPDTSVVDFEDAGVGTCLVWGLTYTDTLSVGLGDNALEASLGSGCYVLSDTFVTVNRVAIEAPSVYAEGESLSVYTCPSDSMADLVLVNYTADSTANFQIVVTDTAGVILGLPDTTVVDFEGAGEGVCLIWGLSYIGTLSAEIGDNAMDSTLGEGCFVLSDTFVTVTRGQLDAGMVYAEGGLLSIYTCPGDSSADVASFNYSSNSLSSYQIVVTDTAGVILGLPDSTVVDFEGAGVGTCLVWGLAYTGELTAAVGDTASQIDFSDGCFALTDTFVTVNRGELDGGMIYAEGELLQVYTCPGDSVADLVSFHATSSSVGTNFQLVITDTAGVILGLPDSTVADFEGAGEGTCLAWGLVYTGTLSAAVGDTATAISFSDGCFALSDNFVTITRGELVGSMVSTADGGLEVQTCPGDSIADEIDFVYSSASTSNFQWVVTDTDGVILGLPEGNTIDFEGAGVGICLVWGLNYGGNLTAAVGDTASAISFSDACFALSDTFVTVVRSLDNCETTNLENSLSEGTLSFFPNPVEDRLTIKFQAATDLGRTGTLEIWDLQGKKLLSEQHSLNPGIENTIEVRLPDMAAGVYTIRILSGNKFLSNRIVKR